MTFDLDATATEPDVSTVEKLENQAALLVAVATGGPRIETVQAVHQCRRLVRDAWDLAQKVTHGDRGRVDAFVAAQKAVL